MKNIKKAEKKKAKKGALFNPASLLLLLPTLIFGVYGLLMELGVIPDEVDLGAVTVEFYSFGENSLMALLEKVCFIWVPVLFVAIVILRVCIGMTSARDGSDGEETAPSDAKKSKPKRKTEKGDASAAVDAFASMGETDDDTDIAVAEGNFSALKKIEAENGGEASRKRRVEYPPVLLKDVAAQLKEYAAHRGVDLSDRAVRSMIAAASSGRALVLDERYKDKNRAVVGAIAAYFGGSVHPHAVEAGYYAPEHLATSLDAEGQIRETGFLVDIYSACFDRERLRFAFLENVNCAAVSDFFTEYRTALDGTSSDKYVTATKLYKGGTLAYMKEGRVLFPENIILVISTAFSSDVSKLFEEAVYPEISEVVPCAPRAYGGDSIISAVQLLKAAERARDVFYLSDEHWNGIDLLEEYLNRQIGYRLDNRKLRLLERYSSAYMAAGGSEAEALDSTLTACVFSELYAKRGRFTAGSEEEPYEFLERVFGAETVPAAIEMTRRMCGYSAKTEAKTEAVEPEDTAEDTSEGIVTDATMDADEIEAAADEIVTELIQTVGIEALAKAVDGSVETAEPEAEAAESEPEPEVTEAAREE